PSHAARVFRTIRAPASGVNGSDVCGASTAAGRAAAHCTAMADTQPAGLGTPWRRLSSRTVYRHPFLTVREDLVALPNGHQTNYCVATTGASGVAVGVLPFVDETTVLMERQWRYIA